MKLYLLWDMKGHRVDEHTIECHVESQFDILNWTMGTGLV